MTEKCCQSMKHFEHMCSLTLNGCAAEFAYGPQEAKYECSPCNIKDHRHFETCTPNLIGT